MTSHTHCSARAGLSLALFVSLGAHGCGSIEPGALVDEAGLGNVESKASALLLPTVTPIDGFAIPAALLDRARLVIIRTAADANTYLGSVPAGVDFTKEFLVFYAGGAQPTLGYKTSLSFSDIAVKRTVLSDGYLYQLKVNASTLLDPPGRGCAEELPGVGLPFTLVRVDATGLRDYAKVTSESLYRDHTAYERTCYEPGFACDATLTAAGLAAINARPRDASRIPSHSTYGVYAQHYLGQYVYESWKEECKAGSCSWRKIIPPYTRYLDRGSLHFYSGSGEQRLVIYSSQGYETFYSGGGKTYPCYLWGESVRNDVDSSSGRGLLSGVSITDNRTCLVTSAGTYRNKPVGLDNFSGVMGDRCVRLTAQTGRPGVDSVLQILTANW